MLVAAAMLVQMRMPRIRVHGNPSWLLTAAGFVVGVLVGVTSVGSASLIVALFALTTPLPASAIVGTDLVHACLLVAVAALAHRQAGTVDLGVSLNLLTGALPGVLRGSRLSTRVPGTGAPSYPCRGVGLRHPLARGQWTLGLHNVCEVAQ
ncbi:MAG: hypothetical protein C4289_03895 [Chloroflexota bacterium]